MKLTRVVVVLVSLLVLSGCFGGSGGGSGSASVQAQIEALMSQYATHFKNKNSDGIIDLYAYPFVAIYDIAGEPKTEQEVATREQAKVLMDLSFGMIQSVESVLFSVGTVTSSGSSATAKTNLTATATVLGTTQTTVSEIEFEYVRVNGKWLIKQEKTTKVTTL